MVNGKFKKALEDFSSSIPRADLKLKEAMKKTELDKEETGIVRLLDRDKENAVTLDELQEMLAKSGYRKVEIPDLREDIDHLIDLGYVSSRTYGGGKDRKEKFYLTHYLVGGGRRKKAEQGRGLIPSATKMYKRWFGSIFMLAGLGFFIYDGLRMTGAIFSSVTQISPGFIFAFALFVIGVFLLEGSFDKDNKK